MKKLHSAAALLLAASSSLALAQAWPEAPVRMIVPLTPGSGADAAGRVGIQAHVMAVPEFAAFVLTEMVKHVAIAQAARIEPQ